MILSSVSSLLLLRAPPLSKCPLHGIVRHPLETKHPCDHPPISLPLRADFPNELPPLPVPTLAAFIPLSGRDEVTLEQVRLPAKVEKITTQVLVHVFRDTRAGRWGHHAQTTSLLTFLVSVMPLLRPYAWLLQRCFFGAYVPSDVVVMAVVLSLTDIQVQSSCTYPGHLVYSPPFTGIQVGKPLNSGLQVGSRSRAPSCCAPRWVVLTLKL